MASCSFNYDCYGRTVGPNAQIDVDDLTEEEVSLLSPEDAQEYTRNKNQQIKNKAFAEEYKKKLGNILENDMKCTICNEIIYKAITASCSHTFCKPCIIQWKEKCKNNLCPICRNSMDEMVEAAAIDSFATDMCNFIGGSVKEQRDMIMTERDLADSLASKSEQKSSRPGDRK